MTVCVPITGSGGLDERVSRSFSNSPYFAIVDLNSGSIEIIENKRCAPVVSLTDRKIQGVVCATMGKRALEILQAKGIRVYSAWGKTLREVIEQYRSGELRELSL
ncbi:MAG: NifB/NifX family molybdenum-iron cluster-binding protein [Firmicutes bacterium]|nr:NifB/NifX family molybdenum-iron cluster-binding protein [Bacillota bacterium]